jgi:hypothetical protein
VRRKLFNLAAAVSLVLFVVTLAYWVTSFFVDVCLAWDSPAAESSCYVSCSLGEMQVGRNSRPPNPNKTGGFSWSFDGPTRGLDQLTLLLGNYPQSEGSHFRFGGFAMFSYSVSSNHYISLWWPCWAATLLTAVVPASWVLSRKKVGGSLCATCGYDLRATPERCPECGTIPPGRQEV